MEVPPLHERCDGTGSAFSPLIKRPVSRELWPTAIFALEAGDQALVHELQHMLVFSDVVRFV